MTIIAAIDRSEQRQYVVKEAAALAADLDQSLHMIHVLNRSEFVDLERTSIEQTGHSVEHDRIAKIAEEFAQEALDMADTSGAAIGVVGNPAEEILRYAQEQDGRYLVVGGRKRTPIGKAIFGSVTQSVLLNADRPVLTVPSSKS